VINAQTRKAYLRPDEVEDEKIAREAGAVARRKAELRAEKTEQQVRELEEELSRLRHTPRSKEKKPDGRKKSRD
jgi:hypothetical protein